MSTTAVGKEAESHVADYLQQHHHKVLVQNWRTKWCEIDIVSTKKHTVYFTEVKYRSTSNWGSGLEYITDAKLRKMRFAAELWIAQHAWKGQACLQAAELDALGNISVIEI